jgi:hypothetical protein
VAVSIRHPDLPIVARRDGRAGCWRVSVGRGEAELAPARRGGGWFLSWGAAGRHLERVRTWPAALAFVAKHAHELSDGRPVGDEGTRVRRPRVGGSSRRRRGRSGRGGIAIPPRVALYARAAATEHTGRPAIERQLERLQAYARSRRWPVAPDRVYRDEGAGEVAPERPDLRLLRDAVGRGEVDLVLADAPDRLARDPATLAGLLAEWRRAGCRTVFVDRRAR